MNNLCGRQELLIFKPSTNELNANGRPWKDAGSYSVWISSSRELNRFYVGCFINRCANKHIEWKHHCWPIDNIEYHHQSKISVLIKWHSCNYAAQ